MIIKTILSPAGSGKTRFMISEAAELAAWDHKVLIIQPTKQLIDQTYDNIRALDGPDIDVTRIHDETAGKGNVATEIMKHFQAADQSGQILLITQAAFDMVPHFHMSRKWDLFIDECPNAFQVVKLNASRSHKIITDHIECREFSPYPEIHSIDDESLKKIIELSKTDDSIKMFVNASKYILSDGWNVYTHKKSYDELVSGSGSSGSLQFYFVRSFNNLNKFRSCSVFAARIEETLFYKFLQKQGAEFTEYGPPAYSFCRKHQEQVIDYTEHNNGHLLDIHHLLVEKYSKNIQKNTKQIRSDYVQYALDTMNGGEFIFQSNKDLDGKVLKNYDLVKAGGKELSGISHGNNEYRGIDNVLILSSFNPTPDQRDFLIYYGLSDGEIDIAIHCNCIYQAVMRCSLRDPKSTTRKKVFLPDKRTASYLSDIFSGSTLHPIKTSVDESLIGKPGPERKYETSAERTAACRARKKEINMANITPVNDNVLIIEDRCNEFPIRNTSVTHATQWKMNIYETFTSTGIGNEVSFESIEGVTTYMNKNSLQKIDHKKDGFLFNFTKFKEGIERRRGNDNVISSNAIILDIDGGDMDANAFLKIIPNVKMIISNTFSSTKAIPKWRVIIPMSRHVNKSEYENLYEYILCVANDNGFYEAKYGSNNMNLKTHGFDKTKRKMESIYFLPCQGRDEGGSFFIDETGNDREILNPDDWLSEYEGELMQNNANDNENHIVTSGLKPDSESSEKINSAIMKWRTEGSMSGNSYSGFKKLAGSLYFAGMSQSDMLDMLTEEAEHCRSPDDRKKDAVGLVDWCFENIAR